MKIPIAIFSLLIIKFNYTVRKMDGAIRIPLKQVRGAENWKIASIKQKMYFAR